MSIAAAPIPQGKYRPAVRHGDLIFTSGMTPRLDGALLYTGPVEAGDPAEKWRDAIVLASSNALVAAETRLLAGERICGVVSLTIFIAATAGFKDHSKLADVASTFFLEKLGEEGIGSRAAVGVATLPGGAPVEITMVASVG